MNLKAAIIFVYILIALIPSATAIFISPQSFDFSFYSAAIHFALIGFSLLALQIIIAAKYMFFHKQFKRFKLLTFHKKMGIVAYVLILFHPVLLSVQMGNYDLLLSMDHEWYILLGKATLTVLTLFAANALLQKLLSLSYKIWVIFHRTFAPLILISAFIHALFTGSHMHHVPFRVVMLLIMATAIGVFIYSRFSDLLKENNSD